MTNTLLKIQNLKKHYGNKEAVKGLNLEVQAGELFILLGPNGAGKTTTLKMLVGLLRPSEGSIEIGGYDLQKDPTQAKKLLSFVPDIPYTYEKLTPRELLQFVGRLYGMPAAKIEERARDLLSFFELADVDDVLMEEFSHGMKQKAVLSAALLHEPKILILDEPMVGLDPISIKSFKDHLKKMTRLGTTVIFSTHTLPLAEELADRVAILHKGELVALGTLKELHQKYASQSNLEAMFLKLVETSLS